MDWDGLQNLIDEYAKLAVEIHIAKMNDEKEAIASAAFKQGKLMGSIETLVAKGVEFNVYLNR